MTHALRRLVALLVIISFTSAACSTGGDSENSDGNASSPSDVPGLDDVDWEYKSFESAVATDSCNSLDSAEFSNLELTPYEVVTVSFNCLVDAESLELSLGDSELVLVQVTPTTLGFVTPLEVGEGEALLEFAGEDTVSVQIRGVSPSIESPRDYLFDLVEVLEGQLDILSGTPWEAVASESLGAARKELDEMSEAEMADMAVFLSANEGLFLNPKATCSAVSKEDLLQCWSEWVSLRNRVYANLLAIGESLLEGVLRRTGFARYVRKAKEMLQIQETLDGHVELAKEKIQAVADEVVLELNKDSEVASGVPFALSALTRFAPIEAAVLDEGTEALAELSAGFFITRDNLTASHLSLNVATPSWPEPELSDRRILEGWTVALKSGTAGAVSFDSTESGDGFSVTLVSTSTEPVPATLVLSYESTGIANFDVELDLVVQPMICEFPEELYCIYQVNGDCTGACLGVCDGEGGLECSGSCAGGCRESLEVLAGECPAQAELVCHW